MLQIAITCSQNDDSLYLFPRYWEVLLRFAKVSGVSVAPVLLPFHADPAYLNWCADQYDGFLITGGSDLDPALYGETNDLELSKNIHPERDRFEMTLLPILAKRNKPVLGICRGVQAMAVALGGTLWQDIHSQLCQAPHAVRDENEKTHHTVRVYGRLAEILETDLLSTNSYHHQAIKTVPDSIEILAHCEDGVVEALALREHPYFMGLQWHPEKDPDAYSEKLFVDFLHHAAALK